MVQSALSGVLSVAEFILFALCISVPTPTDCRVENLSYFPPATVALEYATFAREHVQWLENNPPLAAWRMADYYDQLREATALRDTWDRLVYAHGTPLSDDCVPFPDAEPSLFWLKELRERLGDEAYFTGVMPPPVPMWRFHELR